MSLITKQLFVNQTPLKNQNQELCLHYHKFLSPHRENCNTKSISSLDILTNKGISNQYLNCYISASVHLLLGTTICAMLPNLLENYSVLNNNLHYVKENYIPRAVTHIV